MTSSRFISTSLLSNQSKIYIINREIDPDVGGIELLKFVR